MMRILIDTNILIQLEDNKVIQKEFSRFYSLAVKNKCEIFYHRACAEDISKDKNQKRREILFSKLEKYSALQNPAKVESKFTDFVGEKKDNDRIDNIQLFQLYKGYVELFVTNDKGIRKKAEKLLINDKVFNSKEAFEFLDSRFTLVIPRHPVIDHVSVRQLEDDFDSEFFNSLKKDYGGDTFMEWIHNCAKKDRKCYILRVQNKLAALLIYKKESASDHRLHSINEDAIKICTLKVGEDALGMKLGELFFNKMLELSMSHKIQYLYITTYEKQKALIHILKKFGFDKHEEFVNNVGQKELKFLKSLRIEDQKGKEGTKLHPFFRDRVNKFVIPILPENYTTLFKDGNLRTPTLFDNQDTGLQEVQGNSIIKAYISNSPRKDLKSGDLLFFYSSGKYKSIEPLGVLISHSRVDNFDELWKMVRSKTVYSQDVLEKWLSERKYLTVTIFRLAQYLKPIIRFSEIKELDAFSNKFQTITKLSSNDYDTIRTKFVNESFIID